MTRCRYRRDAWPSATFRLRAGNNRFRLRAGNNRLRFCGVVVPPEAAGTIQTADVGARGGGNQSGAMLSSASLTPVTDAGVAIDPSAYLGNGNAPSVLAFEAAQEVWEGSSPELLVDVNGETLFRFRLPMAIDRVRNMYSWIGARHLSGEADYRNTVYHRIWDDDSLKSCVFFHGANVSGADAQSWSDAVFKRLWLSGANMEFYSVDWRSDIGGPANYHQNASNAFVVASQLASTINAIPGDKVMIAHSLGNMVVSSMIQDYGLQVSKYLMCNSAVPAEAYDTTLSPTNVLVHKDWNEYPRKSFANEWYRLFEDNVGDDRQLLTWGGRFADVADVAVNFYSTGDHVLELERNNNVWATDGYENWDQMFERYSWHKQELWKGRKGLFFNMGTTDWSGWSIRENILGYNVIQPTNAWLMSNAELKTNTVFKLQPESMNANSISLLVRGVLLAKGIPSRTSPSGAMKWGTELMDNKMNDLNSTNVGQNGIARPNGWKIRPNGLFDDWGTRWLHSDMKDMAYFYVFKFFEKVKEEGELQ